MYNVFIRTKLSFENINTITKIVFPHNQLYLIYYYVWDYRNFRFAMI